MHKWVAIALAGVIAQLVDGALGMGYGLTSTTLLLVGGAAPATASAAVHLAEIGTTLAAGTAHWRLGNVDWRTVRFMTIPGALGAFVGAVLLSSVDGDKAKPWVAGVLAVLGLYVLYRFLGRRRLVPRSGPPLPGVFLGPLGLLAGFLDAVGGGGWGPLGTPTLLASGRIEPRKAVGSVSAAEFLVALGASCGFLVSLRWSQVPLGTVLLLLAGGLVAAPLAALLVRHISPRKLGVAVGAMILLTNARTLALTFGLSGALRGLLYVAIVGTVGGLGLWRMAESRRRQPKSRPRQPALA